MLSAGFKVPTNYQQTSPITSLHRNEVPLPRLTHRTSNSDQQGLIPQKKFIISDFDDDMSSVSDAGDENYRNSVSG